MPFDDQILTPQGPETSTAGGQSDDPTPEPVVDPDLSPLAFEDRFEPPIYAAWLTWPIVIGSFASVFDIPYYAIWISIVAFITFLRYLHHRQILRRPGRILVSAWLYLLLVSLGYRDDLFGYLAGVAHFRYLGKRDWPRPSFQGNWTMLLCAVLLTAVRVLRCTVHVHILGGVNADKRPPGMTLLQYYIKLGGYRTALLSLGYHVMGLLYSVPSVTRIPIPDQWCRNGAGTLSLPASDAIDNEPMTVEPNRIVRTGP